MGSILQMQTVRLGEESSGPRAASLFPQSSFSWRELSPCASQEQPSENDTLLLFGM